MLESQRIRRAELQKLDSLFKSFGDVTGLVPAALDWSRMQARLTRYENIESQIINKQVEVNESIKSLRTDAFVPTKFTISDIFALPTISADETLFKENMDVAILKKSTEALSIEEVPEVGVPPLSIIDLNNQYLLIINAYTKTTDNLKDIDLPNPIQEKIRDRPGFKNAKTLVTDTITKQNRFLTTIQKNLKRFAARLRFIDNQTGVSENVKNRVAVDLGFSAKVTASENLREKTQQTKQAALIEYTSNVQKETKDYNTEQDTYTKNASAVIKALETQTKKPITTTDEIEPLFNNMLQSIESLKIIDVLDQQYLNYKNRLEAVSKTLPSKASVDAAPKKGDYLKNWNTDVLVAASALASALDSILQSLLQKKLTDLPQQNALVSQALKTFEDKVSAATVLIESEAERKAKEARKEAERLEKERLEITRLRNLVDNNVFDKWTSETSIPSFISNSLNGIKSLDQLWNDVKSKLTGVVFSSRFINQKNNTLVKRLIDDNAITDEIDVDNMRDLMYVEGLSLDEMKNAWIVFKDTLIHTGSSQQNTKLDELQKTKVVEQPTRAVKRITDNQVKTPKSLANFEKYETNGYNGVMTTKSLEWIENSCWIDTVMMSMFSIPQTEITKRIYNSTIIKTNPITLEFLKGSLKILGCKKEDAESIHTTLVNDIDYIQNPEVIPASHTCSVRPFWDNLCGSNRVKRSIEGTLDDVFSNLKQFYPDSFSYDTSSNLLGNIYNDYNIPNTAKPNHVWNIEDNFNYILDLQTNKRSFNFDKITTHELVAVIYILYEKGSQNPHHYITHIRDFEADKWYHYDRNAFNREKQMRELTSQEYTDNLDNRADYQYTFTKKGETRDEYRIPVCFVFFSNAEVTRLKTERRAFKKSGVSPSPLAPVTPNILPFSEDTSEGFPLGKPNQIETLFEKTIQKTNWLSDEQKAATLLQNGNDWNKIQGIIQKLDRVRLEGLLYAWFIVRNTTVRTLNAEQRLLVGITRADLDELDLIPIPSPDPIPTPAPTPIVITPPPPPTSIILKNLVGNKLFAEPVNETSFEAAYEKALQTIGNRMDLGLGPKIDPILDVLKDRYRLTGLMHAWWGQQNNDEEAKVRGMSMADLNLE
jgi:hypothetical protein